MRSSRLTDALTVAMVTPSLEQMAFMGTVACMPTASSVWISAMVRPSRKRILSDFSSMRVTELKVVLSSSLSRAFSCELKAFGPVV